VENDQILFYSKATASFDNIILIAVSLDPFHTQSGFVSVPVDRFGIGENDAYQVEDLLTSERFVWRGRRNFVMLEPNSRPAHVFRVRRQIGKDGGQTIFR
jgi:starch synthase (maltosyl-transferring)